MALSSCTFWPNPKYAAHLRKRYEANFCEVDSGKNSHTGCPKKNATDLKNSDTSCFKLIIELLFFSKFAIIVLNFDIFFRIFEELVKELKINKH